MIEFEIKFITDHSRIRQLLQDRGAEQLGDDFNHDLYFNHPQRDFSETDEALRIRKTSSKIKLTYKGPKFDQRSKSRKEIDIELPNDEMQEVLELLSFVPAGEVYKKRQTWKLPPYLITLDQVRDLGEFVEIERVEEEDADKDTIIAEMHEFARQLELDPKEQILPSYLELVRNQ